MTIISDGKNQKSQVSGLFINSEDEILDNNSNDIIENSSITQVIDDTEILDLKVEDEFQFSMDVMRRFIEMVNKPRWVVPVLPKDDLECMLLIAIKYSYQKQDVDGEHFKDLYKNGFLASFEKIMMDDAVLGWKMDILESIYRNSIIMIQLCAMKISDDNLYILDILAIIFNPDVKYHQCCLNNYIHPDTVRVSLLDLFKINHKFREHQEIEDSANSTDQEIYLLPDIMEQKYAFSVDNRRNKLIYVDLINIFGHFKGFDKLRYRLDLFKELNSTDLSVNLSLLLALLKPISLSIDYLTMYTIDEFITPIVNSSVKLILSLDEDVLKQEAIKEWKSDKFSSIIQQIEIILIKMNSENDLLNKLSLFRLNIILKILQHASFNGRMNALNELNKLIKSMYSHLHQSNSQDERFEHILNWIKNNEVLSIVLKENLHQPQYVEKVEKLIRFIVKSNGLTNEDLNRLWDSQIGKHEAIVTNIHDLLAKLAYDFNQTQLHHLFDCFQNSWSKASKKQRERLIDLIRKLAEEDKEGRIAKTALKLLWDLAIKSDSSLDILESALKAHIKILDFSCIQDRDSHRNEWLNHLINYLNDQNIRRNAVPTLRQIREIIKLFQSAVFNSNKNISRCMIIQQLDKDHQILNLITHNLIDYVDNFRNSEDDLNENNLSYLDEKFPHETQIDERLELLKFLLIEGSLILDNELLINIWTCLVVPHGSNNPSFLSDRDQCFKWLASLMDIDKNPFEEDMMENFYLNNFLKLDPKLLTLSGILLFEQFFRSINQKKGFIREIDSDTYIVIQTELVGLDYLWRCAMFCVDDEVFNKIIHILKMITTNLNSNLIDKRNSIIEEFIQHCILIMSTAFDTAKCLLSKCHPVSLSEDNYQENYYEVSLEMEESVNKLINIIQILCEFIRECDNRFTMDRKNPSLCRMTFGYVRKITVIFNSCFGRNNSIHHVEINVHSNELFLNLRKMILAHWHDFQRDDCTFEITKGNDVIVDDRDNYKTLEQLEIVNSSVLHARMIPLFSNTWPYNKVEKYEEIDSEKNEDNLPGVIISKNKANMELIISIGDLSLKINNEKLRWSTRHLLNLLPPDFYMQTSIVNSILKSPDNNNNHFEDLLHRGTSMQTIYAVNVLYGLLLPCSNPKAANDSILLIKNLLKKNILKDLLEIIHFDNKHFLSTFVPKICETSSIRLIGLIRLLKIIYLLLSIYGAIIKIKEKSNKKNKIQKLQELLKGNTCHLTISYEVVNEKIQNVLQELENDKEMMANISPKYLPQRKDVESFIKLSWCCAIGNKLEMMSCDIKTFQEKCPINFTERSRSVASFRPDTSFNNINKYFTMSPDINCSISSNNGFCKTDDVYELLNQPTFCAIECLSLVLACSFDTNILNLIKEKYTKEFIMVLLLYTRNSYVRKKASDEFQLILGFSDNSKAIEHVVQMLFIELHNVGENPIQYGEVFNLVVRLLNDTHKMRCQLSNTEDLLKSQLERLLEIKSLPDNVNNQARIIHEVVLIGRLKIIKELLKFFSSQNKAQINKDYDLVNILLNNFLFPSSKRYSDIKIYQQETHRDFQMPYSEENREFPSWATAPLMNPICNTLESQKTVFELLRILVAGCSNNMEQLCERLDTFFYCDHRFNLNEWDYKPSFVSRSATGFVGLKNAGATCYMNSIIQQLFLIAPIRNALLAVDAGPPVSRDNYDDKMLYSFMKDFSKKTDSKSIKINILREVQMIFGNLAFSQNQYFIPSGFWKHFKLWGDEVNLREQHDALEFFNCLVDTVDEGLNSIGMVKIFEEVLGGTFADQKICKGCPHRYECEEKFSTLSVDIRHHENLIESLEQYVKGDLLEGDNAYYCESCKEKRDTVKRMCIKKLPLILAIQLKRFDYDWERDTSVKFNDYFEFPTELDMAPYTVAGTSKRDHLNSINEIVRSPSFSSSDSDCPDSSECSQNPESSTRYTLKGVVVHGGQASGGHYYSYIKEKRKYESATAYNCSDSCSSINNNAIDPEDLSYCWYRFDDTEVSECKMDGEEMKIQWFGGDFMGESYDHIVKRVSLRRQKRWWSAYIVFYEREDYANHPSLGDLQQGVFSKSKLSQQPPPPIPNSTSAMNGNNIFNIARLPRHIEESITLQNIEYMHTKNQYTTEYFSFLRDLPTLVNPDPDHVPIEMGRMVAGYCQGDVEKMRIQVASLISKFLFAIGLKTNRSIRGPAIDWFYSLKLILQNSERARLEFSIHAFFFPLTKITEYLLESPNSEIRAVYSTFIRFISHWSIRDTSSGYNYLEFQRDPHLKDLYTFIKDRFPIDEKLKLCHILMAIMHLLLNNHTNEYGSSANELISIFCDYPSMGYPELSHCLDINLSTHILKYCLDEYYPNAGSPRVDINKLICSFCLMMRCYNLHVTCSDMQIDMLIPHRQVLQQVYAKEPPDISLSEITNPHHLKINNKSVWKIRKIPDHLYKYIFQRTNKFIKRVVEDFYNEVTKDDLINLLKFLCYDNPQCSQMIIETLSNELAHSFIRNAKLFLELFRGILEINDCWKIRRAVIMVEGEELEFAARFKGTSERRCYFIMKTILFTINQLNEDEKKQLWEEISNPKLIHEKIKKAMLNLMNLLHNFPNEQKMRNDFRTHTVIESNEENAINNIERTNSTDEMEKIGKEFLLLYANTTTEENVEQCQSMSYSDDNMTTSKKDDMPIYCDSYSEDCHPDPNLQPPPYNVSDDQTNDDINSSPSASSMSPCASMPSPK